MMVLGRSGDNTLNWVVYSQQLFPSIKNEFVSSSTNKIGYDNLYWRDSVGERYSVGAKFDLGSQNLGYDYGFMTPTGSLSSENSFGLFVSQSCWPLDPPQDFLTRTGIFVQTGALPAQILTAMETYRFTSGAAGELQNCYMGQEGIGVFANVSTPVNTPATFRRSQRCGSLLLVLLIHLKLKLPCWVTEGLEVCMQENKASCIQLHLEVHMDLA